jgi:hypothetical protein
VKVVVRRGKESPRLFVVLVGAILTIALIVGGFWIWYQVRWRAPGLLIVQSSARERHVIDAAAGNSRQEGFVLEYVLRNPASAPVILPTTTIVFKRSPGGSLVDISAWARLPSYFEAPPGHNGVLAIHLDHQCDGLPIPSCYAFTVGESGDFLLLDHQQKLRLALPIPALQ